MSGLRCLRGSGPRTPISRRVPVAPTMRSGMRVSRLVGGERQGVEHREALAVVELAPERRRAAADGDAPVRVTAAHLDVDDAGLGFLPLPARRIVPARQHVLRGHGRMPDEARPRCAG